MNRWFAANGRKRASEKTTCCQGKLSTLPKAGVLTYLEVIDDGFTIQEVVRNCEEVPIKGVAPRVVGAPEKNADFPVHKSLDKKNQTDHIYMPYCELYYGTELEPKHRALRITHSRTPLS